MKIIEIKKAIENRQNVYWANSLYEVIKDSIGQYLIVCTSNDSCIGLTHKDGTTLNGEESEFYIH